MGHKHEARYYHIYSSHRISVAADLSLIQRNESTEVTDEGRERVCRAASWNLPVNKENRNQSAAEAKSVTHLLIRCHSSTSTEQGRLEATSSPLSLQWHATMGMKSYRLLFLNLGTRCRRLIFAPAGCSQL